MFFVFVGGYVSLKKIWNRSPSKTVTVSARCWLKIAKSPCAPLVKNFDSNQDSEGGFAVSVAPTYALKHTNHRIAGSADPDASSAQTHTTRIHSRTGS
mmetsp:Transcript_3390/g.9674  ORF Transcript_3390/g.9674 Transcript_3390/m.9674 type:complete len:98 (-) Transcript_3390:182-475(-)